MCATARCSRRCCPTPRKNFGRAILMPNLIPPVTHHQGRHRLPRARHGGAAEGLDLQAADHLLPHRRHRSRRRRARLQGRRVHRREALSRQRHHQFGRRRHRLREDHARARAHGKDRHAVPDARRGRRSRDRHLRPRGDVHRALSVEMDAAVPRPAHDPGASVVEGRRRFREERGAAGRRHHHALSHDAHPHRLVRLGPEALHVRACR